MCSLTYKLDRLTSNSDGIDNFCKINQIFLVGAGIAKKLGLSSDKLYIVSLTVLLSQGNKESQVINVVGAQYNIICLSNGRYDNRSKIYSKL